MKITCIAVCTALVLAIALPLNAGATDMGAQTTQQNKEAPCAVTAIYRALVSPDTRALIAQLNVH